MAGFEPTPGTEDLAAQGAAAEQAELEEALALVKAKRAAAGSAPVVIEPDGSESDPDAGKYETDPETGAVLLDAEGQKVPVWPYDTITIRGHQIQVRAPKASALSAFGIAMAKGVPWQVQQQQLSAIVRKHVSARSFQEILEKMTDPDSDFDLEVFQELVKKLQTMSTGRPTEPSRP